MSDEEQIKEIYRKYWEYMIGKDSDGLKELMSYDYYLRHMTGVEQSREEFIKGRFYTTRFQRNDRKSIAVGERVWYNKNNCNPS